MASTYLTRTFSSAGNRKTWTMSAWIKRSGLKSSSEDRVFGWKSGGGNYGFQFDNDAFNFYVCSGGSNAQFNTNRKFRDTSAWYHIVASCDTTQATQSDRFKLYINGVQETSFATGTYPNQNEDTAVNQAEVCRLGCSTVAVNSHFSGLMSHVYFIDGTALPASTFGSTDSTTGEWQINTSPTISSYGTNGFLVLKDGNTITDQSPNSNNFTLGAGTLTFTHDNPSNVFCVLNAISGKSKPTLSIGNTKTGSSSDGNYVFGTIGSKAGYYEIKLGQNPNGGNGNGLTMGCYDSNYAETINSTAVRAFKTNHAYTVNYSVDDLGGGTSYEGTSTGVSAAAGDIISVAWKNSKLYVAKNGTYFFSANPSNNTDGSTQVPLADSSAYQLPVSKSNVDGMTNSEWNFGNGYFGTTAITSNSGNGYQDANGQGKFQYQPPTGCYALCTKNLNV
tara:strand:- start:833 stop:2176 length:1344 start_codon:yes stop_codon:yes gene_type:complete